MLAITQPLRVGDWVTFEEQYGVVEDVRLNYTVLRTPGDVRVVIPNERLAAGILRNDTLGSDRIALDVSVWLAPGADVERALAVLADATGSKVSVAEVTRGRRADRDRGRSGAAARARPAPGRAARAVPRKAPFRRACSRAPDKGSRPPGRISAGLHSRGSRRYGERVCSMSRSQRNRRRHRGRGRPRNKAFLAIMVLLVLVALAGLSAVGYVISIASSAPPLDSLKPRELGSQSEVRAADGTRLGFIQSNELRRPVEGNRIPKSLKDATVAIEDERYYHHKGVDYAGIVRAAVKNLSSQKTVQGGSTITMQLVRNLYITKERTYQRKIREAKLAEELENEHTKEWILDKYLNTVPFGTLGGQTAVGVQAASRVYFGKPVERLKLHEAALLAGLPQAPSSYSPVRAPEKAEQRRNEVLAKMAQLGMVTPETARKAMKRGLGVNPSRYFTSRRESFFFDYVKDELIKEYGTKTVRQGGLRVDTTIDLKKQVRPRAPRSTAGSPASAPPRRSSRSTPRTATSRRWRPPRTTASRSSTSPPRATASPARRSRSWR